MIMAGALPILMGASVGSNLLGTAISSSSNREIAEKNLEGIKATNEANLTAVRETNQSNYNLWREQNSEAWKMFDAVNQYNTPANQASRLSAAGINPQLAMSGSNAGTAQSVSMPAAAPMQAGHVDAPRMDYVPPALGSVLESLSSVPTQYAQMSSLLSDAQIKGAEAKISTGTTQYKIEQEMARLQGMIENNSLSKAKRLMAFQEYKYYDTYLKNRNLQQEMQYNLTAAEYEHTMAQVVKTSAETDSARLTAAFQKAGFNIQLNQLDAALKETYARVAVAISQKSLNDRQAAKLFEDTFTSFLHNEGLQMDNFQKQMLLPYATNAAMESLNKVIRETGSWNSRYDTNWIFRQTRGLQQYLEGLSPIGFGK